jgi:hypothetical protein
MPVLTGRCFQQRQRQVNTKHQRSETVVTREAARDAIVVSAGSSAAFEVAGLQVEMFTWPDGPAIEVPAVIQPFPSGSPAGTMTLAVEWADRILTPAGKPAFESGGEWTLYRPGGAYEFVLRSPATGDEPCRAAIVDASFRYGRVLLSRKVFGGLPAVNPLEYPLDELLVIHRLARGEGVEVHACGVLDERGRGLLFVGHSGAGKSTLARLWQQAGAQILGDDRIILRRDATGGVRMYGTPWQGEAPPALPLSAPLSGVYFLEHGSRNELEEMERDRAIAELSARCFLPLHDADALGFALEFLAGIPDVPHSVFRFLPDGTALRMFEDDARAA